MSGCIGIVIQRLGSGYIQFKGSGAGMVIMAS